MVSIVKTLCLTKLLANTKRHFPEDERQAMIFWVKQASPGFQIRLVSRHYPVCLWQHFMTAKPESEAEQAVYFSKTIQITRPRGPNISL